MIRSAGAAVLIALALLAVPGANRALGAPPAVSIDSPVADATKRDPFAISGSLQQAGSDAVILDAKVKLSDDESWLPPVEHAYVAGGGNNSLIFSGGGASVSFNWANIAPRYNGPYTVTVTARGQYRTLTGTETPSSEVSKSFHVEFPPTKPTGVTADKPDDTSLVTVNWAANPESDIAGYLVYRSYAGDAGKQIGSVDGTKHAYTDDLAGKAPGPYKYAVQAVRHARSCKSPSNVNEACSRGITGETSSYSSAVTVRSTPPTTTTTIKKTGGSGGSGGSGGPTPTTVPGSGGSGGSGSTNTRTAAGTRSGSGGFAPNSEVDLSEFGNLLNPAARSTTGARTAEPDGTYDPSLPYGERAPEAPGGEDEDTLITIGGASVPKPSDDWVKFIGAGSLMTALLVHVLWFKQQVDALPLEVIIE